VVKLERPDLARKKAELITQQNEFKVTLAHLEALLLEKLANAEGDILDDTELILSLEEAKKTSDEVKEKVVVAVETELKINETSEFYRPSEAVVLSCSSSSWSFARCTPSTSTLWMPSSWL